MNYKANVWKSAAAEAEREVVRLTATPPGGRGEREGLIDYIDRVRKMQDAALARWITACQEHEAAKLAGKEPGNV